MRAQRAVQQDAEFGGIGLGDQITAVLFTRNVVPQLAEPAHPTPCECPRSTPRYVFDLYYSLRSHTKSGKGIQSTTATTGYKTDWDFNVAASPCRHLVRN